MRRRVGQVALALAIGALLLVAASFFVPAAYFDPWEMLLIRQMQAEMMAIAALVAMLSLVPSAVAGDRRPVVVAGVALMAVVMMVPRFLRTCCGNTEAAAIGALRAINSGEAAFSSSCADGGYAVDLADLAKAPTGSSQGFIDPDLSANGALKAGYIITLARDAAADTHDVGSSARACNGPAHQPASAYFASAVPAVGRRKPEYQRRYFATDTRGTIFFSTTGPIPNPIPPDTKVVQ